MKRQLVLAVIMLCTCLLFSTTVRSQKKEYIAFKDSIARAYELLGNICLKLHQLDQTLQSYRKVLSIQKQNYEGNKPGSINLSYAFAYNNIADIYHEMNKLNTSYLYATESLNIKLRQLTVAGIQEIANSYLNLANILLKMDTLTKVKEYAVKALEYYKKDKWVKGLAETELVLAGIAAATSQAQQEYNHLKNALEIASSIKAVHIQMNACQQLSDYHMKTGDYQAANNSLLNYIAMKDSILSTETNQRITEMNLRYEIENKENESQILHQQNLTQQLKQRIISRAQIVFIAFIITLLFLLISVRRNLKQKNIHLDQIKEISRLNAVKHQRELDFKNRELQMLIEYIKAKNNILNTIKEVMLEEIENNCKAPFEAFQRTITTIKAHLTSDQDWELLEKQIQELSIGFKEKLLNLHPNLTPLDFKLMVFIKLRIPTRGIANILNIEEESVRKQKYRLRKKLGLKKITLEDYLETI